MVHEMNELARLAKIEIDRAEARARNLEYALDMCIDALDKVESLIGLRKFDKDEIAVLQTVKDAARMAASMKEKTNG